MSWLRLDVQSASLTAAVLLVVALAARVAGGRLLRPRWARFVTAAAVETALVCGLFALWQLANAATHHAHSGGLSHGRAIWQLERTLHFPSETSFQHLVLGHPWLVRTANYYYASAHLTGMVVFLVWLWLRHRDAYPRWRNVVALFTGMALLIEMIPVAPPRLIGNTGLVDTAMVYGQSVYAFAGDLADQYAALPSIHVGWALLIAVAMVQCGGRLAGAVGVTHAVLTVAFVVLTANHYWFDGVTAAVVLGFALAMQRGGALALGSLRPSRVPATVQIQQGALS
jgi:PAP2 superfamily